MRLTYRSKLLINFTALFAVFTLLLVVFQYNRERQYKRELLETRLRNYADIVAKNVDGAHKPLDSLELKSIAATFPDELRVTLMNRHGRVIYESYDTPVSSMENHKSRPEVIRARIEGEGSDIRRSTTEHTEFFYLARTYGNFIVRVAFPYDTTVQSFMKADNIFLWFVLMLFPVVLVVLINISDRFGKAVSGLKHFVDSANRGLVDYSLISFPHTELGDIGRSITEKYKELESKGREIALQRERLMRHCHYFEEGMAIFAPDRTCTYANPRFTQYVNTLLDHPTANINDLWKSDVFAPVAEYLNLNGGALAANRESPIFRFNLAEGGRTYATQLLIYSDGSFELTLADITRQEKNSLLKQQISNNITHELRTPVSSIRGYLETILTCTTLTEERRRSFLEKAHAQTLRLTDLIRDVALISKTEGAPEMLPKEPLDLCKLIADTLEELRPGLEAQQLTVENLVDKPLAINGNYTLIYSIFRNLTENAVRYAGAGNTLHIECYKATSEFLYFNFYNTGTCVPEEHLPRLFERFYRVTEGRTRDNGGTGLGLSIVRNAVRHHQGDITVRNRKGGGLEFLFSLHK